MALQAQIEAVEGSITAAETTMRSAGGASKKVASRRTKGLRETHETLTEQVEELYAELDVGDAFPDIRDLGLDFARTLVMAYDAKCIARQKLTGRFFEWDMLDRAVGGKGHALGMFTPRPLHSLPTPCPPPSTVSCATSGTHVTVRDRGAPAHGVEDEEAHASPRPGCRKIQHAL